MGFFGLIFWIVVLPLVTRRWRRRRWERWRDHQMRFRLVDDQQSVIDALETRVGQLEERLDFTEQLLNSRSAPGAGVVPQ